MYNIEGFNIFYCEELPSPSKRESGDKSKKELSNAYCFNFFRRYVKLENYQSRIDVIFDPFSGVAITLVKV